jgi:hypothetical protein
VLSKAGRPRQTTGDRTNDERDRAFAQEKGERTRQDGCHREDAQDNIELPCKDAPAQLPPGAPFKSNRKWVAESGQYLRGGVAPEKFPIAPIENAIGYGRSDHFESPKRRLPASQIVLNGRSDDKRDIMKLGESCRMTVSNTRNAYTIRMTLRP